MLERRLSLRHLLFAGACIAVACAEAENSDSDDGSGATGNGGSGGASAGSGGVAKGGSVSKGGSSGSGGATSQGGSGGKGGSSGSTSKGGSTSAGGSGGTVTTPPPIGCLPMGEGGAGGDTGTAGEGGMTGVGGDTSGGTAGLAGSGGSAGSSNSGGSAGAGGDSAGGAAGANGVGTPLFFDDFENGTAAWNPFANTWSVVTDGSNVYTESDTGTPLSLSMAAGTCWADQVVEARIKIIDFPGQSTGYFAAIFARVVDEDNAYFAAIDSSSSTRFTIRRLLNGSIEKIGGEARVAITYGNWYDIKFEVIGTTLRATFTDNAMTHVLTEMDSRIASGGVGVGAKNGEARFDDVRVTAP